MSIIVFAPFSYGLAADTDIYVLDQTIQQVPPDILLVLDLSGSMRWTPAGEYMYTTGSNQCSADVAFYATPQGGRTCDVPQDTGTYPIFSTVTCSGPFYKTARTISGVAYTTPCSRVEIAKRAVKSILDADGNGEVQNIDFDSLNMRMGYMRFRNCGSDTGTNYNAGCNELIHSIDTPYETLWNTISSATATGGTHLAWIPMKDEKPNKFSVQHG